VIDAILAALWFFLPAGMANGAPVIATKVWGLRDWRTPMDFGKSFRGKRIFGANKTWRGLFSGILTATVVVGAQKYLYTRNGFLFDHTWFDYRPASVWLLGPLFGAGVIVADAVESFFKRQRGVAPGDRWFPFDQIDYIIGGCVLSLCIVRLPFSYYAWVLIVWFGMHMLTVYLCYLGGLREKPI
jgi:CDP-2,3-bis-(O-geranylgeranyl)-sn-glycerol synthase